MSDVLLTLSDLRGNDSGVALEKLVSLDRSNLFERDGLFIWNATDGAIGHQRGRVHPNNPSWWVDETRQNDRWTCYGPYVDLSPGRYYTCWEVEIGVSCPPMITAVDYWVLEADAVANVGDHQLWGPKGVTWETACNEAGRNIGFEFDVPPGVSKVEVRLCKRKWMDWLIAKSLTIVRKA